MLAKENCEDTCSNDCDFAHNQELGVFIEVILRKLVQEGENQGQEDEGGEV